MPKKPKGKGKGNGNGGGGGDGGGGGGMGGGCWKEYEVRSAADQRHQWTDAGDGNMVGTTGSGTHTTRRSTSTTPSRPNRTYCTASGQPYYRALASTARSVKAFVRLRKLLARRYDRRLRTVLPEPWTYEA